MPNSFDIKLINHLVKDLSRITTSKYGYAYQRDFTKGPLWYPRGVISGLEYGNPERKLITKWANAYYYKRIYNTGDFRDIYPINIISQEHLDSKIEGQRLEDWVIENPSHGIIEKLDQNLYSWQLQHEEIKIVQKKMQELGLLLSY